MAETLLMLAVVNLTAPLVKKVAEKVKNTEAYKRVEKRIKNFIEKFTGKEPVDPKEIPKEELPKEELPKDNPVEGSGNGNGGSGNNGGSDGSHGTGGGYEEGNGSGGYDDAGGIEDGIDDFADDISDGAEDFTDDLDDIADTADDIIADDSVNNQTENSGNTGEYNADDPIENSAGGSYDNSAGNSSGSSTTSSGTHSENPVVEREQYWKDAAEKYGDNVADRFEAFGEDGKAMLEQYGDELKGIVANMSEEEAKQALELVNVYRDDAVELLKAGKDVENVANILKSGLKLTKKFKNQVALEEHFERHGSEIADVLDASNYSINEYLDDAIHVIENGTYVPELNGFVEFMQGKKYGFVGLDRETGDITTFHIKTVDELIKKAPSLGLGK